jgi:3-oxoacyl-[acyl-carrier protein] reductase
MVSADNVGGKPKVGRLDGRVAVITGAARGIGAAEAIKLSSEGAKIAIFDISADHLSETVWRVQHVGGEALPVVCDVTSTPRVRESMAHVVDHFGRIDILVNNAGVLRDNLLFRMTDDDWDTVLDIHLKGSFICSREAQVYMVKRRYGKIVMTSSITSLGNRGQSNYSAAKAGLQGMARTMAIELGPFNINVNVVAPGWIVTDMLRKMADRMETSLEALESEISKTIALRGLGQPEDVANVVSFLVSEEAAYINGQTIYVAGGPVGILM